MSRTISLLEIVQEAKPGADGVEPGAVEAVGSDDAETGGEASDDPEDTDKSEDEAAKDLADVQDALEEKSTDVSTWPQTVLQN